MPAQTPEAKPAPAQKPAQDVSSSRISPSKKQTSKIKINKLRTVKNKTKKAEDNQPDNTSITKTQKRDKERMQREMEKYKQANSAHNN